MERLSKEQNKEGEGKIRSKPKLARKQGSIHSATLQANKRILFSCALVKHKRQRLNDFCQVDIWSPPLVNHMSPGTVFLLLRKFKGHPLRLLFQNPDISSLAGSTNHRGENSFPWTFKN
ncbi:hypothetical protein TNCV_1780911 [Trichonephila clavipes]|nr:hypothetical protein TNCV_1780911 [Trichonephila clavipes]